MKKRKPVPIQKKLLSFQQNSQQRARFERALRQLPLASILWPSCHIASFPREFCIKDQGRECVFPLAPLTDRIHYAGVKLEELARAQYEELHPVLAYFILSRFEEQLRALGADLKMKNRKKWLSLCRQIEKQKKSLDVPRSLCQSKNYPELCCLFLSEFQNMSKSYTKTLKRKEIIETELAAFRLELDMKQKQNAGTEKLQEHNRDLGASLKQERKLVTRLEKEIRRITEQILSSHHLDKNSSLVEEYQNLKHEYNLLTRKNDALVSKNIELANRVDQTSRIQAYKLEEILDMLQKRINVLLQREYSQDPGVLLTSIKKEITELKRARTYLGRALYNVGLLYIAMGDSENALKELRAARELGVSDIKAEKLIANLS